MRHLPFLLISLLAFAIGFSKCTCIKPAPQSTIFVAQRVITLDDKMPQATAIGVRGGIITAVGTLQQVEAQLGNGYTINRTYQDAIITPGMIEAHCHLSMLALLLPQPYVGAFDFPGLDGHLLAGTPTRQGVLQNLQHMFLKQKPLRLFFAWGYDPMLVDDQKPLTKEDLDAISSSVPIFVLNSSGHAASVNSAFLAQVHYTRATSIPGVVKDKSGHPTGILEEVAALEPAFAIVAPHLLAPALRKNTLKSVSKLAKKLGLTTVTDMFVSAEASGKELLTLYAMASSAPEFPIRIVLALDGFGLYKNRGEKAASYVKQLADSLGNPKLRIGNIKFIIDGSIQGFTARLLPPGYFNGAPNGMFNLTQAQFEVAGLPFWKAGLPLHVHANGDEATQVALNTLAHFKKIANTPTRFVLEHNQMAHLHQFQQLKTLGGYTNLFINNLYNWGEVHYSTTLGPTRAASMDNAGLAKSLGIPFSLHSDSPITPLGPLQLISTAITRQDRAGRVLAAPGTALSAYDALYAVTLGAATMLGLEKELGSICVGKRADFTILAKDPLTEPAAAIRSIPVVGTVLGGQAH